MKLADEGAVRMDDSPQSKGGQARAAKLPSTERSSQASNAARARWDLARDVGIHEAVDVGTLNLPGLQINCAVLDDEMRVISGTEFMKIMGMYRSGYLSTNRYEEDVGFRIPLYLSFKNLIPFVLEDHDLVDALRKPILYRAKGSRSVAEGIDARVIRRICNVWVRAASAGGLGRSQAKVADKAKFLLDALADVAIVALIDEATGYQRRRAGTALQAILAAYVNPEFLPYQARFPVSYYEHIYRVMGWDFDPNSTARTAYVGQLTNKLIYDKLPPGVLEDLRKKNPVDPVTKRRKRKHFQHLTEDVGHPHLQGQITAVTTLLRATPNGNWRFFETLFNQAFPPIQPQLFSQEDVERLAIPERPALR